MNHYITYTHWRMFVQENNDCLPRELIFIIFHWFHYSIHLRVGLVRDLRIVIILILISRLKVCIILQLSSRNTVPPTGKCYWNKFSQEFQQPTHMKPCKETHGYARII